ncbi:uncharacterized protein I206_102923 [Kwoniella pini CBS 10737]|uniref:Uncharacterized protein n=1 Tax=Kwoniella pini CBS 10737 TaxID=1296096 RepID=A0A1B9I6Q0_9TREE|nr:uncharacterized protein I206_03274 [Kwoniella pini CBS 10737]OCF51208.1 hypothetical protein I206_03274 [Kwoniella pini CBS 10737]
MVQLSHNLTLCITDYHTEKDTEKVYDVTLHPGKYIRLGQDDLWTSSTDGKRAYLSMKRSETENGEKEEIRKYLEIGTTFHVENSYHAVIDTGEESVKRSDYGNGQKAYCVELLSDAGGTLLAESFDIDLFETRDIGPVSIKATTNGIKIAKTETYFQPDTTITTYKTLRENETHWVHSGFAIHVGSIESQPHWRI